MPPAIEKYPITFARVSKMVPDSTPEPMLWNSIAKRNTELNRLKMVRI